MVLEKTLEKVPWTARRSNHMKHEGNRQLEGIWVLQGYLSDLCRLTNSALQTVPRLHYILNRGASESSGDTKISMCYLHVLFSYVLNSLISLLAIRGCS